MKKELISEALGEISDKHIEKAAVYRKANTLKIAAAVSAAVLALVIGVVAVMGNQPTKEPYQVDTSEEIYFNTDDFQMAMADMDIQIEWYDFENLSDEVKMSFEDRVGIAPEIFISRLPEGFTAENLWTYLARYDENGVRHEEYKPYDYRLEIKSPSEGSVRIALCGKGEPLRDCIIVCDNAKPSAINGTELYIYKMGESYYTCFESGGIYYDIETDGVGEEEFIALITSLTAEIEEQ